VYVGFIPETHKGTHSTCYVVFMNTVCDAVFCCLDSFPTGSVGFLHIINTIFCIMDWNEGRCTGARRAQLGLTTTGV
jgi:hypothetical protein